MEGGVESVEYLVNERNSGGLGQEWKSYILVKKPFLRDVLTLPIYLKKRYEKKLFVLNSGSCASTYLTELLKRNGVSEVYHNKHPSMDYSGVKEYLGEGGGLARLLVGISRIRINVEISHDIFPFSRYIKKVYPNSRFIHLHRDGVSSIRSIVNKVTFPEIFEGSTRIRYASKLAGKKEMDPFSRACKYWANINRQILEDLEAMKDTETAQLRFRDLVKGNLECVEKFLGRSLPVKTMEPVRTKEHLKDESAVRIGKFSDWPADWKRTFIRICGPVHRQLGYEMPDVDI